MCLNFLVECSLLVTYRSILKHVGINEATGTQEITEENKQVQVMETEIIPSMSYPISSMSKLCVEQIYFTIPKYKTLKKIAV